MKFKVEQRSAKVPGDVAQVVSVFWEPADAKPNAYAVWLITPNEMASRIKAEKEADNPVGLVIYASIVGDEVIVSPLPASDGNLRLRYNPPMKEA